MSRLYYSTLAGYKMHKQWHTKCACKNFCTKCRPLGILTLHACAQNQLLIRLAQQWWSICSVLYYGSAGLWHAYTGWGYSQRSTTLSLLPSHSIHSSVLCECSCTSVGIPLDHSSSLLWWNWWALIFQAVDWCHIRKPSSSGVLHTSWLTQALIPLLFTAAFQSLQVIIYPSTHTSTACNRLWMGRRGKDQL